MEEAEKVKVVVRLRPISEQEIRQGHRVTVETDSVNNSVTIKHLQTTAEVNISLK